MKRCGIESGLGVLATLAVLGGLAVGCGSGSSPTLEFDLPINRDVPVVGADAMVPDPGDSGRDPGVDPGTDPGLDDPGVSDPGPDGFEDPGISDPGIDPGPPECELGDSRTVACGLNGRGEQRQVCVDGFWRDFDACIDPDVCTDGEETFEPCGINGRGKVVTACVEGAWVVGTCEDPDECVDDDVRTVTCGTKDLGQGDEACIAGAWVAQGGCRTPGRWQCVENQCTPVFGAATCGNGDCEPKSGESPQTCAADCGGYAGTSGEGVRCREAIDCVFYDWPIKGYGYWECGGFLSRACRARADEAFCGTDGFDYCYFTQQQMESDQSCPLDCPGKSLACQGDFACIYHPWPEESW